MIKAVLFDGYGTLFSGGMDKLYQVCQNICDDHDLDLDGKGFLEQWDEHFFPLIRGDSFMTFRKAHAQSLVAVFEKMDIPAEPTKYVEQIFELLGEVTLYEDVVPTLTSLNGFPHGVVSNADSDHLHNALSGNGLSFDLVVSSEDAEAYKPNPAIFDKALAALGVEPGEVLYVGDSQEDDLVASHRGGIRMAWLNREGESLMDGIPKPKFEITSLSEVLDLIKNLGTTNEHK
jgi:2-haloalkanoic acid dehalogenase type II